MSKTTNPRFRKAAAVVVLLGGLGAVGLGLFPPWQMKDTVRSQNGLVTAVHYGSRRAFVGTGPATAEVPGWRYIEQESHINTPRLAIEWAVVLAAVLSAIVLLKAVPRFVGFVGRVCEAWRRQNPKARFRKSAALALLLGGLTAVGLGLFPPWRVKVTEYVHTGTVRTPSRGLSFGVGGQEQYDERVYYERLSSRAFIGTGPRIGPWHRGLGGSFRDEGKTEPQINVIQLNIEWAVVLICVSAAVGSLWLFIGTLTAEPNNGK